jgi:hypothetical protein
VRPAWSSSEYTTPNILRRLRHSNTCARSHATNDMVLLGHDKRSRGEGLLDQPICIKVHLPMILTLTVTQKSGLGRFLAYIRHGKLIFGVL